MPSIFLVDNSLTTVKNIDNVSILERSKLFVKTVILEANNKLKPFALASFATSFQLLLKFSDDQEALINKLQDIKPSTKSCLLKCFTELMMYLYTEWGSNEEINLFIISDGNVGNGKGSLKEMFELDTKISVPLPCHFFIVLINKFSNLNGVLNIWQLFLSKFTGNGHLIYSEDDYISLENLVKVCIPLSKPCLSYSLKCGDIIEDINLYPDISLDYLYLFKRINRHLKNNILLIEVLGFVEYNQIINFSYLTKHLITPTCSEENPLFKAPKFAILLHGSLKLENMAAFIEIKLQSNAPDYKVVDDIRQNRSWFGFLYSSFTSMDTKKKSNLFLSLLPPGFDSVPLLGDIKNLAHFNTVKLTSPGFLSTNMVVESLQDTHAGPKKRLRLATNPSSNVIVDKPCILNIPLSQSANLLHKLNQPPKSMDSLSHLTNIQQHTYSYSALQVNTGVGGQFDSKPYPLYTFLQQYKHSVMPINNASPLMAELTENELSAKSRALVEHTRLVENVDVSRLIRLAKKMITSYETLLAAPYRFTTILIHDLLKNNTNPNVQKLLGSKIDSYYRELTKFRARVIVTHLKPMTKELSQRNFFSKYVEVFTNEVIPPEYKISLQPMKTKGVLNTNWNIYSELQYSLRSFSDFETFAYDSYLRPTYYKTIK